MDGRQGYDVLGFIYEYLIGMFAANFRVLLVKLETEGSIQTQSQDCQPD